jgi:hypothetical protein
LATAPPLHEAAGEGPLLVEANATAAAPAATGSTTPKRGDGTSVKPAISRIGTYMLGLVILLALLALPALFIFGSVWVGEKILPWLMLLCMLGLAFNVFVLVPLALIPPARPWAGLGFFISSYLFGLTGWFMGLLLTWKLWGGCAVAVGIFILGIGVVPIAMLATLLNGMWLDLGFLVLAVVLTFGLRLLGAALAENV